MWAKMARTEVQFVGVLRRMDVSKYGPSWHGQDVQYVRQGGQRNGSLVSQGDLDKLSNSGVKTTLVRESLLWCQEGIVLGRPQPGGLSFVFGPRGLKALRVFGESPNGGQDVRMVSKGKGWGVPSQGGPGRMGKGMLGRLVVESSHLSPRKPDLAGGPRGERAV